MLPDSIVVNNFVSLDYENNKQGSGAKISELYANLKYVKITLTNTGHKDHIHMSFSPERGGIYVDESGSKCSGATLNFLSNKSNCFLYSTTPRIYISCGFTFNTNFIYIKSSTKNMVRN